jgi:hypothetical protein
MNSQLSVASGFNAKTRRYEEGFFLTGIQDFSELTGMENWDGSFSQKCKSFQKYQNLHFF